MRFVDHKQRICEIVGKLEIRSGLIGGNGNAAGSLPIFQRWFSTEAMHCYDSQFAELLNFTAPVDDDACRAYDNEMRCPGIP